MGEATPMDFGTFMDPQPAPGPECTCYPGGFHPDQFEGPQVWCDVHGQPSAAYDHGVRAGQRAVATLGQGAATIAAERERQLQVKGWTLVHDAHHKAGDLAKAAACYALPDGFRDIRGGSREDTPELWPWESGAWKPTPEDRVRELAKAGALIAAEIDRVLAEERGVV